MASSHPRHILESLHTHTLSLSVGAPALLRADKGTIEAQYAGLERPEETPTAAMTRPGVYAGVEKEDENSEHVELVERVPCRRCSHEDL